ncbi:metallophosphoesterase [Desulfonatronum sp. SC1]|uniref:metallophosphoesterase family protein n=1 Tax=Desulfonatronum sp. SC1 TaxID=2109626 RepID=UPI0013049F87|nr:metallophosphoesterase [Desulfonatronum sp. SC1]
MRTLLVADPHGDYSQILAHGPRAKRIIIAGDLEPPDDLRTILGPLADKTWYILGNHDAEKPEQLARLESMSERCLHRKVVRIGDLRVAGLNGVFNGKILNASGVDRIEDMEDLSVCIPTREAWLQKRRLGMEHVTAIFKEDLEAMAEMEADVLILHEAPECHPNGFQMLGDLARYMGVRLVLHGHHHEHYEGWIEGGIKVLGLGTPGGIDPATYLDEGLEWLEDVYPFPSG